MHDSFISYATEDNDFAAEVAYGLRSNGLSVWFAPLSLRVGDKLLDSIEKGLQESRTGILILTPSYLAKNWTSYEMDILIRQHVDRSKKLLPIWLGVTKAEIDERHIGLGGIVAVTATDSIGHVISQLVASLSDGAPSRAVIPSWENPAYRFLQGLGEVNLQTADGPATTIFEFLLHAKPHQYPLWLAGRPYSQEELLLEVAHYIGADPDRVKNWVAEDGYKKIWEMCVTAGFNPVMFS